MRSTIRNSVSMIAAVLAFAAFGPGDAHAAFVVKAFSCTTDPFGVKVDVSGLGNKNLCIVGSVTADLSCACATGGGNCPSDTKKQLITSTIQSGKAVEPDNGRVTTTFTLPISFTDGLCSGLDCPTGQTERLVEWDAGSGATFTVCKTSVLAGQDCTCPGDGIIAGPKTCGPTGDVTFAGKKNSCLKLFD